MKTRTTLRERAGVKRWRHCDECGKVLTTLEVVAPLTSRRIVQNAAALAEVR